MKEIKWYRENIDLSRYIIDNYDYHLDKDSSRNSPKLRSSDGSQVITIKNYSNGWRYFFKTSDEKGSIIDFVQNREGIYDLGKVRGILDQYVGDPSFTPGEAQSSSNPSNNITIKPISDYFSPLVLKGKSGDYNFKLVPLKDLSYLKKRYINSETINDVMFADNIFNSEFANIDSSKVFFNTSFPIFSKHELINPGTEHPYKRRIVALQNYHLRPDGTTSKRFMGMRGEGIWRSNIDVSKKVKNLILTEQPLDAISHKIIKSIDFYSGSLYYSFFGQISNSQLSMAIENINYGLFMDFLNNVRYNLPENIVFAFDKDAAGGRYTMQFLDQIDPTKFGTTAESYKYLIDSNFVPVKWENDKDLSVMDSKIKVQFFAQEESGGMNLIDRFKTHFKEFKLSNSGEDSKFMWGKSNFSDGKAIIEIDFKNTFANWKVINDFLHTCKFGKSYRIKFDESITKDWNEDLEVLFKSNSLPSYILQ